MKLDECALHDDMSIRVALISGMRRALKIHPDSRCDAATRIEVEVARPRPGNLQLRYVVTGKIGDLVLPPVTAPARSRRALAAHLLRGVFPLGRGVLRVQLRALARNGRPIGSTAIAAESALRTRSARRASTCSRTARALNCRSRWSGLPNDAAWRLGLSAVIEETSGRKSYWALAHPPGKADFHHSDCFALELPAAVRP